MRGLRITGMMYEDLRLYVVLNDTGAVTKQKFIVLKTLLLSDDVILFDRVYIALCTSLLPLRVSKL